ncbi:Ras-related protein Rab-4B [Elysia marginata]|uniref:Ras-related protein Rab-4B n=1 Tax=Elysia marginata TaxID=1093978 RepID=A0AAV4G6M1_9GAST|nr:Ras-related protein Rab-4B [Elysia marginata]
MLINTSNNIPESRVQAFIERWPSQADPSLMLITDTKSHLPSRYWPANRKIPMACFDENGRPPLISTVTIVGEAAVGKTSIIQRFRTDKFIKAYTPTIGVERSQIVLDLPTEELDSPFLFRFLDTNDIILDPTMALTIKDRLDALHASLSRYVIVVYDITNHSSFEAAKDWVRLARQMIDIDFQMLLVGNKADMTKQRAVHKTAGQVFAILNNMTFLETSAKSGYHIHTLFNLLVKCN